jgi:NTP pyrophosphatase (non-canonical NTP hydrolase)
MNNSEMTQEREARILEAAVETYGAESQIDMMIEEMSELTKALCKYKRSPDGGTVDNVLEEMADVQIMLNQMALIFDDCTEQEIVKLVRLESRLGGLADDKGKPMDWDAAAENLYTYEKLYRDLPDGTGFLGLIYISSIKTRYESGERTAELYDAMTEIE